MGTQINKMNGLAWTADDLQKKFGHTYVRATVKNGEKVVVNNGLVCIVNAAYMLEQPSSDSVSFQYPSTNVDGKWIDGVAKYKDFLIEEDRPDPCISNILDTAFIFCYNPARQWQRGFNSQNAFIFTAPSFTQTPGAWTKRLALNILHPEHTHLEVAVQWFKDNPQGRSRALNNRYLLLRTDTDETLKLYRRKAFMGSFIGKKFFVNDAARIFDDELKTELPILRDKYAFKHTSA